MQNKYFSYANVVSPITSSDAYSILHDLDPVLFDLSRYYENVIKIHLQDRWNIVCPKIGRTDLINKIVAYTTCIDPLPFANEAEFDFPLLALFREEDTFDWHSFDKDVITSSIQLLYILPPLSTFQFETLNPFLKHINRVIVDRTIEGSDQQLNVDELISSGIKAIQIESSVYGKLPKGLNSNQFYPCLMMNIMIDEIATPVPELNFEDFSGMDGYLSIYTDGYENSYSSIEFLNFRT